MSKFSDSVRSYLDVHQAFEAAGLHGSLLLEFRTNANATTWAARANAYRVLLRKQNEKEGREFACEFDHLVVRRKPGESRILIEPRGFNFVAKTPDGETLEFDRTSLDATVPTPFEKTKMEADVSDFLNGMFGKEKK